MTLKLTGMSSVRKSFDAYVKRVEERIADVRREIAAEMLEALLENIPVWSGKTVRSIAVSNSESGGNAVENHPDRGSRAKDGRWKSHKQDFGDTLNMPLGAEPKRGQSEAIARASVASTSFAIKDRVYITSNSYLWAEIDSATYRPDARNNAVVSEIAKAQIRAKFGGLIK